MATEIIEQIQQLKDPNLKQIMIKFTDLLKEKDQTIIALENRVTDLELRVSEQERFSSKDCVIVQNAPVTAEGDLWAQMAGFFTQYLGYRCNPEAFKACHPLGSFRRDSQKTVIVKFIYFHDKNEIFSRRALLAHKPNNFNNMPIYINERLPKHDAEIRRYAESLGIVTTTRNCQVRIFHRAEDGTSQSFPVNSVSGVDQWAETAVKRNSKNRNTKPVSLQSTKNLEQALKRIREKSADIENNKIIDEALNEITSPENKRANLKAVIN